MPIVPYPLARPFLFGLDPERGPRPDARGARRGAAHAARLRRRRGRGSTIRSTLAGLRFPNRVGLAAGLDKNGRCIDAFGAMGFGFVEVGTVTPLGAAGQSEAAPVPAARGRRARSTGSASTTTAWRPSSRNVARARFRSRRRHPRPEHRQERGDADRARRRRLPRRPRRRVPARRLRDGQHLEPEHAQPARPAGRRRARRAARRDRRAPRRAGARARPDACRCSSRSRPISRPAQVDAIAATLQAARHRRRDRHQHDAGTRRRRAACATATKRAASRARPLLERSNQVIATLRAALGPAVPIIGVGGVMSGADALAKRRAGADLVQIYTGLIYRGPAPGGRGRARARRR